MASPLDPSALVKEARTRSGLSQRALARRAGTSQSVVARIELGATSPTVGTLNRLLEAAGMGLETRLRPDARASRNGADIRRRLRDFFDDGAPPGLVSAYLFGSAADGRLHADSDIDVAVLLDRSRHPRARDRAELRVRLGSELVAALGANDVDLVVLNDIPPGLARRIVVDGERIVCEDEGRDHAFRRDVQLRWADLQPFLRRYRAAKLAALER